MCIFLSSSPFRLSRLAILTCLAAVLPGPVRATELAREILAATDLRGGLALHAGTSDGALEADLALEGDFLVRGLSLSEETTRQSRTRIEARGATGLASIQTVTSLSRLPLADDLARLVVVDLERLGDRAPSMAEIHRVLAPGGTAHLRRKGRWTTMVEARPPGMDDWQHWDHGADGNPSSSDVHVGPTHRLRWLAGPTNVHRGGSKVGLRISDGVMTTITVEPDPHAKFFRRRQSDVVTRDAWSGLLLWKRSIEGVPGGGDQPSRFSLTARDGRIFTHTRAGAPLEALDARTGKTLARYEGGPVGPPVDGWNKWKDPVSKILFTVRVTGERVFQTHRNVATSSDVSTGELQWRRELEDVEAIGWAVATSDRLFLVGSGRPLVKNRASHATPVDRLVALDTRTGDVVWENRELAGRMLFRMIHHRDSLLLATFGIEGYKPNFGKSPLVVRLDAATGDIIWKATPRAEARGHYSVVMARGDEVFVGQQSGFRLALEDGALRGRLNWGQDDNSCADLKCVPDYTLYGLTFIDRQGQRIQRGQTRTICDVGLFPANGLLYGSPLGCLCSEYINGYSALSSKPLDPPVPDGERLRSGPAAGSVSDLELPATGNEAWPMFRADPRRSAWTPAGVSPTPAKTWKRELARWPDARGAREWQENEKIPGVLTAPVAVRGQIFVAAPDAHRVFALEMETGEVSWTFTAGGRVDSPPTILTSRTSSEALCVFGSRDGHVYALRASDGSLAWKFLAARTRELIVVRGQLESPWPVFGSVLVDRGDLVVTAGRQSAIDGGIAVYRLDFSTGARIWQTRLFTDPDSIGTIEDPKLRRSRTRNQRVNELLVHDGEGVRLWITPIEANYEPGESVDIEKGVYSVRAMRHSVPSRQELRDVAGATWIWSASSGGLLSRRSSGVGRFDGEGVNYANLNATRICLTDGGRGLIATSARCRETRELSGGLVRLTLEEDGSLPGSADWRASLPGNLLTEALVVAGKSVLIARVASDRPDRSILEVHSLEDGSRRGGSVLPARLIADGLILVGGQLFGSFADGTVRRLELPPAD